MATRKPAPRIGVQGWQQFLSQKKQILDAYERAKEKAKIHEIQTHHGLVLEAAFREWLIGFLPKRFGVTSGYIISQSLKDHIKTPHYDIIIYDEIESPILWSEQYPGLSEAGISRAIPAEYVYCVMEVKSSMEPQTSKMALEHLFDLEPLLALPDPSVKTVQDFLPTTFACGIVFAELRQEYEVKPAAINNLVPFRHLRGYFGGLVLRGKSLEAENTGKFDLVVGNQKIPESSTGESLFRSPIAKSRKIENQHVSVILTWSPANFSMFAFDLVARLKGRFRPGYVSSWHGLSWLNPDRMKI